MEQTREPATSQEAVSNEQSPAAPTAEPSAKPDTTVAEKAPVSETAEQPSTTQSVAVAPAPAIPPSPAPNVPMSHLVLYVHEDSWADVRDAQQRRLLYETIPAGRVVSVDGVAPLSVFLGNVDGVTVEFNGQPYDALRHKRGQVARFTLGQPSG